MMDLLFDFIRMFIWVLMYFVALPISLFFFVIAIMYVFGWAFMISPFIGLIVGIAEVALVLLAFQYYIQNKR